MRPSLPTDWLTFPPARRFYALASKEVGQCFGIRWCICEGLQSKFRRVKVRLLILTTTSSMSQSFPRREFRCFSKKKKTKRRKFCCGSPSSWFVIFKNKTNICHYFPSTDLLSHIQSILLFPISHCITSPWNRLFPTTKSYQILKKWNISYLKQFTPKKWEQRFSFWKFHNIQLL